MTLEIASSWKIRVFSRSSWVVHVKLALTDLVVCPSLALVSQLALTALVVCPSLAMVPILVLTALVVSVTLALIPVKFFL